MKTLKVLSTSAIVAALLATCGGVSAFAEDAPAIDQSVTGIVIGDEGEEDGEEEGEEEGEDESYATFGEYFDDNVDNEEYTLEFVSATKDGAAFTVTVDGDTVLADLGLADGEYVFTWKVDGTAVDIEVDVDEGTVEIYDEVEDDDPESEPDPESKPDPVPAPAPTSSVDDEEEEEEEEEEDGCVDDEDDEEKDDDVEYDIIDVVNAARNAGVNDINVNTLRNFLILNDEYFDSDDYAEFIEAINEISDLYIAPVAAHLFHKKPAELSEPERRDVYRALSSAEIDVIQKDLIKLAKDHGVLLTWDKDADGYPVVYGSMLGKCEDGGTKCSSGTQVSTGTSAVKATGALPEEGTSSAAAFAGVALALAAAGVVIVARKNRA